LIPHKTTKQQINKSTNQQLTNPHGVFLSFAGQIISIFRDLRPFLYLWLQAQTFSAPFLLPTRQTR